MTTDRSKLVNPLLYSFPVEVLEALNYSMHGKRPEHVGGPYVYEDTHGTLTKSQTMPDRGDVTFWLRSFYEYEGTNGQRVVSEVRVDGLPCFSVFLIRSTPSDMDFITDEQSLALNKFAAEMRNALHDETDKMLLDMDADYDSLDAPLFYESPRALFISDAIGDAMSPCP
jgi:hypothetical protein